MHAFLSSMSNLIMLLSSLLLVSSAAPDLQTFIIQVRPPPPTAAEEATSDDLEKWYRSFLPEYSISSTTASPKIEMLHMYTEAITGFAARLSASHIAEMSRKPGFLRAHPDRTLPLLTTHTPAFLGLQEGNGFWTGSRYGRGVIIGLLDSGVYPHHPSFRSDNMPPPPAKWKGGCDANFTGCNNKLIGARSISQFSSTPLDTDGHGTHTASTAAGMFVERATLLGNGNGTASGMAPFAHVAVYKVCGNYNCSDSDILVGMDLAIKDGVDVMSLSIGGLTDDFYDDLIAIGAFSAAKKGMFVSCAAGNSGPNESSLENAAPWYLSVGASTMDRNIRATVKLGDGQELHGESAFQPKTSSPTAAAIFYPKDGDCYSARLKDADVKGKVVLCQSIFGFEVGDQVKQSGGAAMILMNMETEGYVTFAEVHSLPASHVSYADGMKILNYISSSATPTASIVFEGTITGPAISPAPTVAGFSSRGPSVITPGILKPDVIGPGVNVLAAWPLPVGPPSMSKKYQTAPFNMISGTSMSTPHLSGIAALVKSEHPEWSPAAIKSAIMTTSDVVSRDGKPIMNEQHRPASFYQMGAGHVNPSRAADPGLVYDIDADDYVSLLCGLGYTDHQVETIVRKMVKCKELKKMSEVELNYPSISLGLGFQEAEVNRTVTTVGEATETYTAKVKMVAEGVEVSVSPETMEFTELNQKKTFTVKFSWNKSEKMNAVEGNLIWISEKHVVRSPIVIS